MILWKAERLNERGRALEANGQFAEAEAAYRGAADARPEWAVPWFNLGLLHKYRGNWQESLDCNLRATELAPTDGDSWWNLGIAATALGRWDVARRAWARCDISIPPGDGPIQMELGAVPIRLATQEGGEVVWSRRIDPARAVLVSVPLPSSRHRWGDLVLHDGAANGYRLFRGQKVPVFDELTCLQPSVFATFIADLESEEDALEALPSIAEELGGAAEDWSTHTRMLCKECSEGTPGHFHDAEASSPADVRCGIAARDKAHAEAILAAWLDRAPHGRLLRLEVAVAPNRRS